MFTDHFLTECITTFVILNVCNLVIPTIVECFHEKSIFKTRARKQNEGYWKRRVREAVKAYVYSVPAHLVMSVVNPIWDLYYAELYCTHANFHLGRSLVLFAIYLILFDALIYWMHRFFHIRSPIDLYKRIHSFHHQFHPVTAYAADAAHPVESLIFGSSHFIIAMCMSWIFPFDRVSHQIPAIILLVWGIIVHDETFLKYHTTHHDTVNYNFGQYWRFWDVICNTYKAPSEKQSSSLQKEVVLPRVSDHLKST